MELKGENATTIPTIIKTTEAGAHLLFRSSATMTSAHPAKAHDVDMALTPSSPKSTPSATCIPLVTDLGVNADSRSMTPVRPKISQTMPEPKAEA